MLMSSHLSGRTSCCYEKEYLANISYTCPTIKDKREALALASMLIKTWMMSLVPSMLEFLPNIKSSFTNLIIKFTDKVTMKMIKASNIHQLKLC